MKFSRPDADVFIPEPADIAIATAENPSTAASTSSKVERIAPKLQDISNKPIDAPASESVDSTPAPVAKEPAKPSKPQAASGGIFGRLFPKLGAGRPTSLEAALSLEDVAAPFRESVSLALTATCAEDAQELFRPVISAGSATTPSTERLSQLWQGAGLQQAEAAEAFADVASSMVAVLCFTSHL